MATKKVIIKIDKYTHYDEDSAEIEFGEASISAQCSMCGRVISVGNPCWRKRSSLDEGWALFHENCVKAVPIESAIKCVIRAYHLLGET